MTEMQVLEIGSKILLDGHRLQYEVTWWDERTRKSEWVDPFEIQANEATKRTLRFA